jgi:hypothetical protein
MVGNYLLKVGKDVEMFALRGPATVEAGGVKVSLGGRSLTRRLLLGPDLQHF